MTPKKKHIIVKSFPEQKETHRITCDDGKVIDLFIGRKYGDNDREINPSVCEVLFIGEGVEQLQVGDLLIVHHNLLKNDASKIEKNTDENYEIISLVADNMIYAIINKEDGSLTPVFGNCIAERIIVEEKSTLFTTTQKTEDLKFKIISIPLDFTDVNAGDTVLCYKYSDYEMVYNFNGRENRAIRIWKDDILGVYN
jgi:hypothetical protein